MTEPRPEQRCGGSRKLLVPASIVTGDNPAYRPCPGCADCEHPNRPGDKYGCGLASDTNCVLPLGHAGPCSDTPSPEENIALRGNGVAYWRDRARRAEQDLIAWKRQYSILYHDLGVSNDKRLAAETAIKETLAWARSRTPGSPRAGWLHPQAVIDRLEAALSPSTDTEEGK